MNKFFKTSALLIFTFLLLSCVKNGHPVETPEAVSNKLPQTSRKTEESNVYSFLLNKDSKGYIGNSPTIIIVNKTTIGWFTDNKSVTENFPTLHKETLADYQEINQQERIIQLTLATKKPYEIISADEIYRREANDSEWFRTYTITTFSGIGFNSTFDQALVYMQHDCGGECATGDLYFLVRDKNGWKIESILEGWVS